MSGPPDRIDPTKGSRDANPPIPQLLAAANALRTVQGVAARTLRALVQHPHGDGRLALDLQMPSDLLKQRTANPAAIPSPDRILIGRMVTAIIEAHEGRRPPTHVRSPLESALYRRLLAGTRPSAPGPA
jgi:hypothetical protein